VYSQLKILSRQKKLLNMLARLPGRGGDPYSNRSSTNSFGNLLVVRVLTAAPSVVLISKQSGFALIAASLAYL